MAGIEDFVKRITRLNRKFTFLFTDDFFDIVGRGGVQTGRYLEIRNSFKNVDHRKGSNAEGRVREDAVLFDVEVGVIRKNYTCFLTSFKELADGPYGSGAIIPGGGGELVDAQKAKFMVESFLSEKSEQAITLTSMLADRRKRQLVLVV